jgi:hypothetical protein
MENSQWKIVHVARNNNKSLPKKPVSGIGIVQSGHHQHRIEM